MLDLLSLQILYLQEGFWNHSSAAFSVLSQPPSICCLPDNPQHLPLLKQQATEHHVSSHNSHIYNKQMRSNVVHHRRV